MNADKRGASSVLPQPATVSDSVDGQVTRSLQTLNERMRCRLQIALCAGLGLREALAGAMQHARRTGLNTLEIQSNCQGHSFDAGADIVLRFATERVFGKRPDTPDCPLSLHEAGFDGQELGAVVDELVSTMLAFRSLDAALDQPPRND